MEQLAVAAAEQVQSFPVLVEAQPIPLVISVQEMPGDQLTRQRSAKFIGATLLENKVDCPAAESAADSKVDSLHHGIQLAEKGDIRGRQVVEASARTDVIERTLKAGHVIEVKLEVDGDNDIHQHGQPMEKVQSNSLKFASNLPQMQERTKYETNNTFRIKALHRQGMLKDYSFVVFSRAADNMTLEEMKEANFFVDTMSTVIQVTTIKDGVLTIQSAFVGGIKKPGQPRHDSETIVALGEQFGIDLKGKSAAEIIDTPTLIHNSLLPNGAVDLVERYDDCAGGTFFGEEKPREDYVEFLEKCKWREKGFEPKVQAIVNELIAQAPTLHSQIEACHRLNKISGKHMVDKAIEDTTIDPNVFGEESAGYIIQARRHIELGNFELAQAATNRAKATEQSSSCPGGVSNDNETDAFGNPINDSSSKSCSEIKNGQITNCPHCGKKGVRAIVPKKGGPVFCDNKNCERAAPDLKSARRFKIGKSALSVA